MAKKEAALEKRSKGIEENIDNEFQNQKETLGLLHQSQISVLKKSNKQKEMKIEKLINKIKPLQEVLVAI